MTSRLRFPLPAPALLTLALAAGAAGCAGPGRARDPGPAADPVEALVDELVGRARSRADVNAMRVGLHELFETDPYVEAAACEDGAAAVNGEIERALLTALAERVHVIDVALVERGAGAEPDAPARDGAARRSVTHLVAGSWTRRGSEVLLNLRLVDARSFVVVAAVRGRVPAAWLSDRTRLAWLEEGRERAAVRPDLAPAAARVEAQLLADVQAPVERRAAAPARTAAPRRSTSTTARIVSRSGPPRARVVYHGPGSLRRGAAGCGEPER